MKKFIDTLAISAGVGITCGSLGIPPITAVGLILIILGILNRLSK